VAKAVAESVTARLGKERWCKTGLESGAISDCAGADGRPLGLLPMKIVPQYCEQARRVYYDAAFEIKKEN
jgi:hypothetical protein